MTAVLTRYCCPDNLYEGVRPGMAHEVYLAHEADAQLSALQAQLTNAQSEARLLREHLEGERERVRELEDLLRASQPHEALNIPRACLTGINAVVALPPQGEEKGNE